MYSVDLYGRVRRACHVDGMPIREAARVFGLHRETVSKMLLYSVPPGYRRSEPVRRPKLDPFATGHDTCDEQQASGLSIANVSRECGDLIPPDPSGGFRPASWTDGAPPG
jgi:hypothetical protein